MIRFGRAGLFVYVAVFAAAGAYALLLLIIAMKGLHGAANTMIFGCGVFFVVRCWFAVRAGIFRLRAPVPWLASDTIFAIGDVIAIGTLGLTAWAFATNENRMEAPVAPFGIGLAISYPFYLAATFQSLRREWADT